MPKLRRRSFHAHRAFAVSYGASYVRGFMRRVVRSLVSDSRTAACRALGALRIQWRGCGGISPSCRWMRSRPVQRARFSAPVRPFSHFGALRIQWRGCGGVSLVVSEGAFPARAACAAFLRRFRTSVPFASSGADAEASASSCRWTRSRPAQRARVPFALRDPARVSSFLRPYARRFVHCALVVPRVVRSLLPRTGMRIVLFRHARRRAFADLANDELGGRISSSSPPVEPRTALLDMRLAAAAWLPAKRARRAARCHRFAIFGFAQPPGFWDA
ncbi:hypothetical protein FB451DRAFT_1399968 [Mycena latifolia]|nr:hypothetical protein FB451DRAFT_1399968 [Mycena latifolia]